MTMPGANVGGANFGIGIDLAQFERDLNAAEQLARSRASRIQAALGQIPLTTTGPSITRAAATAVRQPSVPSQPSGGQVPPWVRNIYDQAIAQGTAPGDVIASLRRAGVPPSALSGLASGGGVALTASSIQQEMRAAQQRAERDARVAGRSFSVVGTGRQVGTLPGEGGGRGFLQSLLPSSPQTITRTIAAFTGIGLGLNVAVGAARELRIALADSVAAAVRLEESGRQVGVAFGTGAGQFTGAGAASFAANPLTRGTQPEYQQLVARLGPLANQFQLTGAQIQQVTTISGELARIWGVDLQQAGSTLEQVLRGNLQAGQALDLQLTDEFGALRGLGLTYAELSAAVGPAAAAQKVLAAVQVDADRQLQSNATNADATVQAFDRLGKASDDLKNRLAELAKGPAGGGANALAFLISGPTPEQRQQDQAYLAQLGKQLQQQGVQPDQVSGLAKMALDAVSGSAIDIQNAQKLANEATGATILQRTATGPQLGPSLGEFTAGARLQASQAAIRAAQAQAQIDTLSGQSDLRRLGVQDKLNEVAQKRLDIEGQLAPLLLDQQQTQDRITLATRENLDLTERTLQAQQAAIPSSNAAFALNYQQQRVRLEAQVQFSRALRGLPPAPGIAGIPDLFGQARDLALAAPEIKLAALNAQYPADVAARAQAQAAGARQLSAIPDQRILQAIQDQVIPLTQAQAAAQTAADAIERSLQGADLVAGPARIKAEQDLAAARLQQADAAAKIAAAQGAQGGFNVNASADVTIAGLTDVQAAATAVLDALRPVIEASIRAAASKNAPIPGRVGNLP